MSRRTHQQALAWRDAALAHLVSIPLRAWADDESTRGQTVGNRASQEVKISSGKATLTIYLTGSVAIGGPAGDADLLAEALDQHGFIDGWHPGSRGSGVVWVPQSVTARPITVRWAGPDDGSGVLRGLGVVVAGWEGRSAKDLMDALLALPPRS